MLMLSAELRKAVGRAVVLIEQGAPLFSTNDPNVWSRPIAVPGESGWYMLLRQRRDGWWWVVKIGHMEEEQ